MTDLCGEKQTNQNKIAVGYNTTIPMRIYNYAYNEVKYQAGCCSSTDKQKYTK